jgi:NADPH-dependent curcumin reductase CurA
MLPTRNRQVVLASRPVGIPQAEHFAIRTEPLREIGAGELIVRNEFLSVDPAMRGWVNAAANYSEPVAVGEVMRSFSAGRVIASRHPHYEEGDRVMGMLGWQEYAVTDGGAIRRKVLEDDMPLSLSLGVLGLNGTTAYFALTEVGQPRPGDTVVVSTAAGAVGSAVGQIAKLMGCRTVGIAGGAEKVRLCRDEFGYDAAIDYRAPAFERELAQACAQGVDVYFDNTSGRITDTVLPHLARRARMVVCGTASVPSWDPWPQGPRVERHLLVKSARIEGFLIWDYEHRAQEAVTRLAAWIRRGELKYREEILEGLAQAPDAIAGLYRGENLGKRVIRVDHALDGAG